MHPPGYCSGNGMMMMMHILYSASCRIFQILSDIKLSPASDFIYFGNPYSEKIILHASVRLSADTMQM